MFRGRPPGTGSPQCRRVCFTPMHTTRFPVFILVFLAAFGTCTARADVDVIPLKYRNAEQVLPILRPLVEPGGALTGMQNQLVIRASAANIADIRRVLASLDTMPRRLQISVRQDSGGVDASRGASANGNIVVRPGGVTGNVDARFIDTRGGGESNVLQTLQVMEGGVATINAGQSIPVPGRVVTRTVNGVVVQDTTSYRNVGTGFQVVPHLAGERVTLEINPRRDTPGSGGVINVQGVSTTLSGRLGEWMELGGINSSSVQASSGILSGATTQRSDNLGIWVKVEELR